MMETVYYLRRPILITTAPCMRFGGSNPKMWLERARDLYLNGYQGTFSAGDFINAMSVMEMVKQPSLMLRLPQGLTITPVLPGKNCDYCVDGPNLFLMRAIEGKLMNWKLWAVEIHREPFSKAKLEGKVEIWLHFIHTMSLECESFRVVAAGGDVVPQMDVIMEPPDQHYYKCYFDDVEKLAEVEEYERDTPNGGTVQMVRKFSLDRDGACLVKEL